jgi:hypothetical protein
MAPVGSVVTPEMLPPVAALAEPVAKKIYKNARR